MLRRAAPLLVAVGIAALIISYIVYTWQVVVELRRDGDRTARMFGRVYTALNDTTPNAGMSALLDLSSSIAQMGVPVVVTDDKGAVQMTQNIPFDSTDTGRMREFIAALDRENPPIQVMLPVEESAPRIGMLHYGHTPLARWLRIIPFVQAIVLGLVIAAIVALQRARGRAGREKVWAGMARESAHQLGTPLSSLSGWIELLGENANDPTTLTAITHMRGDLERLERVAHRFERIGRPPKSEPVDIGALAERMAAYFRARVPTLAHTVLIRFERGSDQPLIVQGDPVLLEWALEALIKNAVDALAGRGGTIVVSTGPAAEAGAVVRVADDGPGIPTELQRKIFRAGFSTKSGGWGIGLSLARRIIEQSPGGKLTLVSTGGPGATFEIILR